MPTYYKLRAETITITGAIGGSASVTASVGGCSGYAIVGGDIDTPIASASWNWHLEKFLPGAHTTTARVLSVSCFGDTDSYSDTITSLDGATDGEFEVTCECDVCLYTDNPQTGTGDLAPFWDRKEDTPPNTRVFIVLVPQPDQDVTATLTIGSLTVTATGNTGSDPSPLSHGTQVSMSADAGGTITFISSGTAAGSASGSIALSGWPTSGVAGDSCTAATSAASSSSSTGAGTCSVEAEGSVSGSGSTFDFVNGANAQATASRGESGDREAQLQTGVFNMIYNPDGGIGMYSEELTANLTGFDVATVDFTGSFEETVVQQQCTQSVTADAAESIDEVEDSDTCSDSDTLDTYSPLAATIDSASLATNGDDTNATRLLMRGKTWGALTLEQDTDLTIDTCDDLTVTSGDYQGDWTISGAGSVSIASSAYVQFSGVGTTLTRSYDPPAYLAGYRWLWLRVRADAASKTLTVTINGKAWDITTSGTANTWTSCWIDLCLPPNKTATEDGTNTRWPEDIDGYPTEGTDYYGIGSTDAITITGMASGVVYQLDYLKLSCGDVSGYGADSPSYGYTDTDTIPSFGPWLSEKPDVIVSEAGTTTSFYLKRFLHALVEETGQGIEEPAWKKQVTVGGVTGVTVTVYTHLSLLSLIARLNNKRYPGVTCTDLVPMPTPSGDTHPPAEDEYYNSDLYAVYLGGGGVLALNAPSESADPNDWFQVTSAMDHIGLWVGSVWTETALSLNAQPLYDSVGDWFAGCGDVFDHRNEGDTDTGLLWLRAATILRPHGRGIVADSAHAPLDAITVTLYQGGIDQGHGDSETGSGGRGEYVTLLPFAKTPVTSSLETTSRTVGYTAYTRLRQRAVFVEGPVSEWLSADSSPTGRLARAYVEGGNIWVGFSGVPSAASWTATNSGFAGETPTVRYDQVSARLVLSYKDGGNIKIRYTDDEGSTWSVSTTIGTGTKPAHCISPTGVRHFFWVSGGAIKRESLDSQGNTILAESSVVASGVDDDAIAAAITATSGTIYLQYRASGSIVVVVSTDGGSTFS